MDKRRATAQPEEDLNNVLARVNDHHLGEMPVTDQGDHTVGSIRLRDVVPYLADHTRGPGESSDDLP